MKIGIVSDVHGDSQVLALAIDLLRRKGAETIVSAGDLVIGTSAGRAAVALAQREGLICVQGNHDLSASQPRQRSPLRSLFVGDPENQADRVDEETAAILGAYPVQARFEADGKRVLLTHASPWDQTTYLYPQKPDVLRLAAKQANADILIVGHTHTPMKATVSGVVIVNAGAIEGCRNEPFHRTCGLLDVPSSNYQVFSVDSGQAVAYDDVSY